MTEPSGARRQPRRPVVVPVASLLTVTAVGITALLGGLEEVDIVEPLGQGAVYDQGLYTTKFVEAKVSVEKGEFSWEEDKRFVEMIFEVTNESDETKLVGFPPSRPSIVGDAFAGSLLKITPPIKEGKGPFAFALAKDGQTSQLHPGMTSKVVIRFRLDPGEQPPKKMVLDVGAFEEEPGFQDPTIHWQPVTEKVDNKFRPKVKARVTLPVKPEEPA